MATSSTLTVEERNRRVRVVLAVVLALNWAVAIAKLVVGLVKGSAAVTADGMHSFIDGSSNVLGLVAMSIASRPADEDHPYGHGKFEAIASLGIGAMVGIGMLELGRMAVASLVEGKHPEVTPSMAVVMLLTLAMNIGVTITERRAGQKYQSPLLLADARHTLSDVYVTSAVLLSLALVWLGYPKADGVGALIIMGFVAHVGYTIIRQAVGILSDSARLDPGEVVDLVRSIDGVLHCRDVRSRGMEGSVYVDLKIDVDPRLSTISAHELADEAERRIMQAYPQVVDVVVHVEPHTGETAVHVPTLDQPSAR